MPYETLLENGLNLWDYDSIHPDESHTYSECHPQIDEHELRL